MGRGGAEELGRSAWRGRAEGCFIRENPDVSISPEIVPVRTMGDAPISRDEAIVVVPVVLRTSRSQFRPLLSPKPSRLFRPRDPPDPRPAEMAFRTTRISPASISSRNARVPAFKSNSVAFRRALSMATATATVTHRPPRAIGVFDKGSVARKHPRDCNGHRPPIATTTLLSHDPATAVTARLRSGHSRTAVEMSGDRFATLAPRSQCYAFEVLSATTFSVRVVEQ